MNINTPLYIWDKIVRLCHWSLVVCFVVNYFIVEPGRLIHEIAGYSAVALLTLRIVWGVTRPASSFASLKHIDLSRDAFQTHLTHIKHRNTPAHSGHNPLGWLMVMLVVVLFVILGVTGFMMEEIDAFFGSSTLDQIHSVTADILYGAVCVHVLAVIIVQWRGNISLIRPMISGKRSPRQ